MLSLFLLPLLVTLGDGEVGLTVVVETYNDVSKTRIASLTALSWVESVQNIMYLEPSGIVEREQPYTYYVESSTAATSDFSLVGTCSDVPPFTRTRTRTHFTATATISSRHPFKQKASMLLLHPPPFSLFHLQAS